MSHTFHPEAEAEFFDTIEYYESREPGLGSDFAQEIHSAIRNILSFPKTWPVLEGDVPGPSVSLRNTLFGGT
jgi:hypothetical protein